VEQAAREIEELALIESAGPWPFTTRRTYRRPDRSVVIWQSRIHRKSLGVGKPDQATSIKSILLRSLWLPLQLNWWIGILFAAGSLLFILGSILTLEPEVARYWSLDTVTVNAVFFAGSIPFTTAAYLQLFQAANAGDFTIHGLQVRQNRVLFGWRPHDIGWLSCALQFPGTLLFNVNTFDTMIPGLDWLQQDMAIWVPDVAGSLLFLASGYLAFIETCHKHFGWRPKSISWWITLINLLGCVAFMVSAVFAVVLQKPVDIDFSGLAVVFTLLGGAAFLLGSLLLLPETATAEAAVT